MSSTVRKPANVYSDPSKIVCVTGAGGFIASWLVKVLLDRGYTVRGTVRNPDHSKNYHLWGLEGAKERLTLHKADILDYMSLKEAMRGCGGVFHTAFPVTNDPGEVLIGAINGTKNVVKAAADAKVKRVVFTSSIGAVHMDPNRGPDVVVDENCWSDLDYCKKTENWYCYGKVVAERAASEMARQRGVELVVVIPVVSVGAMLQTSLNASSLQILKYLKGHKKTYANAVQGFVHVKDVAEAHLLVYENPSAHGRYLCTAGFWHRGEFFKILSELFPEYPLPSRCSDEVNPMVKPYKFSNQRLKDLGLQFTPIQQGLCELVKCFQDFGHLQDPAQPRVLATAEPSWQQVRMKLYDQAGKIPSATSGPTADYDITSSICSSLHVEGVIFMNCPEYY